MSDGGIVGIYGQGGLSGGALQAAIDEAWRRLLQMRWHSRILNSPLKI